MARPGAGEHPQSRIRRLSLLTSALFGRHTGGSQSRPHRLKPSSALIPAELNVAAEAGAAARRGPAAGGPTPRCDAKGCRRSAGVGRAGVVIKVVGGIAERLANRVPLICARTRGSSVVRAFVCEARVPQMHGFKRFADDALLRVRGKTIAVLGPNEAGKTSLLGLCIT